MPDLGPVASSLFEIGGPLVGRAFRAFASSLLGAFVLAILVCIGCWSIASAHGAARGLLAVAFAFVVFAVAAGFVAVKRAIMTALIHGFTKLQLGERTTKLLFERLLAVDPLQTHGERGSAVVRTAERLPLAAAEARLQAATDSLLRDDPAAGFFRRRLRAAAIERVSLLTLSKFRDAGATHGGVDLGLVQADLAGRADQLVVDTLRGAALKVTALFLGLATLASVGVAFALRH